MPHTTYQITFANALTKLRWGISENQPVRPTLTEIEVSAARNEVTGFQILLDAGHEFVLVTDGANWLHPLGFLPRLRMDVQFPSLPAAALECFTVGYIEGDDRRWCGRGPAASGQRQADRPGHR